MGPVRLGRRRIAATLIACVVALSVTAAPAPITLTCQAANEAPAGPVGLLCDALAEQLDQRAPGRPVLRDAAAPPPEALALVLTVTQALPHQITAQLAWQAGEEHGTTPPLSLSVVDTTLRPGMYDRLARALLAHAGIVN
jgi:hypothetical protein